VSAPTSFGLAFFLRVAIPGVILILLATPLIPASVTLGLSADGVSTFLVLAGLVGIILTLLDTVIYDLFEGRIGWPEALRKRRTEKWRVWLAERWGKLLKLRTEYRELRDSAPPDNPKVQTLRLDLSLLYESVLNFPLSENGQPYVVWPTRFGNVMASYEDYPETRYGMDSAFYWYRLWLLVPEDVRKEYDNYWAAGQVWLYVAAISIVSAGAYCLLAIWTLVEKGLSLLAVHLAPGGLSDVLRFLSLPRASERILDFVGATPTAWDWRVLAFVVGMAGLSFVVWTVSYSTAITQHRVSGEFFKSLFDNYRGRLKVQKFKAHSPGDWRDAANFLTFLEGGSVLTAKGNGNKD
jgi:hypothetical protein